MGEHLVRREHLVHCISELTLVIGYHFLERVDKVDECGLKEKPVVTDRKGFLLLSRGEVTHDR